jgi:phospholipase/carboxylesterase
MNSIPLSTIELHPAGEANATVIWMHGLGADGNDFVPIVPELRLPAALKVRFVFPNALERPVTVNGGANMRAWYDIAEMGNIERKPDEASIRDSQMRINKLIEREIARGIPAKRIVLAGFSQGGVIALQTGLRYGERLGGILALSTYLALGETLNKEGSVANKDIPIFMAHGIRDAVIGLPIAEKSKHTLTAAGYKVQWQTYPMEHSVSAEEVGAITKFLREVLG